MTIPWEELAYEEGWLSSRDWIYDLMRDTWSICEIADYVGCSRAAVKDEVVNVGLSQMVGKPGGNRYIKLDREWREIAHDLGFKCENDLLERYRRSFGLIVNATSKNANQVKQRYHRWGLLPCWKNRWWREMRQ